MYTDHWKLKGKPFENTPDPRFMYYSKKHEEALVRLLYGVKEEKGAVMLTGEHGSGKTVLSRLLISELLKDKIYEVALITHPQLTPLQFLHEIIYQLKNRQIRGTKPALLHEIQNIVYQNHLEGKRSVIMIDEAQIIKNKETFEELRLLLNFQLSDKFLLTLILLGQPELRSKVNAIPQLEQRLGIRYHLTALTRDETQGYILHRLSVSGCEKEIFTADAIDSIFELSGGSPRSINNICDLSLLIGFGCESHIVDRALIENIAKDMSVKEEMAVYA